MQKSIRQAQRHKNQGALDQQHIQLQFRCDSRMNDAANPLDLPLQLRRGWYVRKMTALIELHERVKICAIVD
jgi:hypothetical protein